MKLLLTIIAIVVIAIPLDADNTGILRESSGRLLINYRLGDYEITDDGEFSYIETERIGNSTQEGAPLLPETVYYVAVPENGNINVNLIDSSSYTLSISSPIVPNPAVKQGEKVSEYIWDIDHDLYQTRSDSWVNVGEKRRFRYNYIVPVIISPVSYDYSGSRLEIAEELSISVTITGDTGSRNAKVDPLDISSLVINPDDAARWQYRPTVHVEYAPFGKSEFWYKFETPQDGIYKLTAGDLADLPLDDIDPSNIRIFTAGGHVLKHGQFSDSKFQEIPVYISGENTGSFDEDDFILFYGQNRDGYEKTKALPTSTRCPDIYHNPYSQNGVYWITYGGDFSAPPRRMDQRSYDDYQVVRDNSPVYYHFESENVRNEHRGFTWFHSSLSGTTDSNHNYRINITDPDLSEDQELKIGLLSETSGTKTISVSVNNQIVINRRSWTLTDHNEFSGSGNFLQNGDNEVTLTIHRTAPITIYFDYFRVEYYRQLMKRNEQLKFNSHTIDSGRTVRYNLSGNLENVLAFEIDGFAEVNLLELSRGEDGTEYITGRGNRQYVLGGVNDFYSVANFQEVVPRDLANVDRPVQNIIITPDVFLDYAERLADIYESQDGMASMVVRQQAIFDQFNGGMPDPLAVRRFLVHVFHNYPDYGGVSLKNVVLMGSGSIDWRNFSGQADIKNRIIVYHRVKDTSDDYFVDMTGDLWVDIGIGRITAQNTEQMNIIFQKFEDYRNNPTPGLWKNTILGMADDEYTGTSTTEIVHTQDVQHILSMMSKAVITDKVFGIEHPFDSFGNKPTARNEMIEKINEGRLIWLYIGHGSYDLLGHETYFRSVDIELLENRDMLPLFIAASCGVGKFDYHSYSSMSERLLAYPNGGSIASLAATEVTSPSPNRPLMASFLDGVVNDYISPGISLMLAKQRHTPGQNRRYHYLGDPVMKVSPPQRIAGIKIEDRPDSLFALQTVNIKGSFNEEMAKTASQQRNGERIPEIRELRSSSSRDNPNNQTGRAAGSIAEVVAYSSERYFSHTVYYTDTVSEIPYSKWGKPYFRGSSSLDNGEFSASFMVPNDIRAGNEGRILSYFFDEETNKDYISYYYPKRFTSAIYENAVPDSIPPHIDMWLNTEEFKEGDIVPPNPVLHAVIEDQSGVNILGELGHKILLMLDEETSPIDVTDGFAYDKDSFTRGRLKWQLSGLEDGDHRIQLIVFDNHNNPSVANMSFTIKSRDAVVITEMLPYPNPMDTSGYFTFILNSDADITINIYTIRGRRIRTMRMEGRAGFNKKEWDVRDSDGDRLANNTYLYKIRARQAGTGDLTEKIGQVVVLR